MDCLTPLKYFAMNTVALISGHAKASVANSEVWEKNKKYTVYKVLITAQGKTWAYYRRYNEFYKLYELLKKQLPGLRLKLPGRKLFGNNFDPLFIRSRREGLNDFVQKLVTDQRLFQNPYVKEFLGIMDTVIEHSPEEDSTDETLENSNESVNVCNERPICLGPSEKLHGRPSDFEFLKVIGKGSFGKVLLAKHKSDGKIYAVKVLQKKAILRRNEARHIMSERNVLLKNLNHPFLVGLHFSFQTKNKLYFVLDYVNGGELFFHLQQQRFFSEARAKFYAAEMASAIGYLHSQGIGHIVLTDFGLCKEGIVGTDTTNTFCGTPEYLAPEILQKQAYDRSVDWWCLGVVLYEMLFGLPPFYSRNMTEMYDNILHKPLKLKNTQVISPAALDILQGLLQKDKSRRLGSGKRDFEMIKEHQFFSSINWDDLVAKKVSPPYHPNLNGIMDLKNIDPEFTKEPVPASVGQSFQSISASVHDAETSVFDGFSYVATGDHFR
ncbi:hypothetical protein CHUAL_004884 [Chamberlinius hualienensis]